MGKFKSCKYYITFKCNSKCRYCNVWRSNYDQLFDTLPIKDAKELLRDLKNAGVEYIDFTGGEPTLYPHLKELLIFAKELNIYTEMTTNGQNGSMDDILPYVDEFNISIDTLQSQTYVKNRGIDGIKNVFDLVADVSKKRRFKMIMVASRENAHELKDLLKFARENNSILLVIPEFFYFDGRTFTDYSLLDNIMELFFEQSSIIHWHFIKLTASGSPVGCASNSHMLTIAPNGNVILPCFHSFKKDISFAEFLADTKQNEKYKDNVCSTCRIIPYYGITFQYSFTKFLMYQSYSEAFIKYKLSYLNPLGDSYSIDSKLALEKLNELDKMINMVDYEKIEAPEGNLLVSKFTPFALYNDFYNAVYPYVRDLLFRHHVTFKEYCDILNSGVLFQIDLWKYFIASAYTNTTSDLKYVSAHTEMIKHICVNEKVLVEIVEQFEILIVDRDIYETT